MKWLIPFLASLTLTPLIIVMPLVSCSSTEMKESGSLDSRISSLSDTVEIMVWQPFLGHFLCRLLFSKFNRR